MELSELRGPVVLDIPSDPASLFLVRAVVGKICQRIGLGANESDKLMLAVDEACTNIIRHAYKNNSEGRITLSFVLNKDSLEISIRDFGSASDPSSFQSRDLAEVRPGGLGVHFIRSAVDKLEYDCPPGGGTILRMIKLRPKQETAEK